MVFRAIILKRGYAWSALMICFDSELFPQNFVWQLNNDRKSLDLYYECLKYVVRVVTLSVNRKARPVVEGEHDKSWNDHGSGVGVKNRENLPTSEMDGPIGIEYTMGSFELI